MRIMSTKVLLPAAIVGVIIELSVGGYASQALGQSSASNPPQKSASAPQQAGSATGTLTVGSSKLQLSHAYAFPEKDKSAPTKENYRIFVTDQPLTASAVKFAASAGSNEVDRQQLVVELSDHKIHGLEIILAADKRVLRANIYTPEFVLGMMLLEPTQFQATALDSQRIAGKLFTEKPIQDIRINKSIQYEATFSASIHRSTSK